MGTVPGSLEMLHNWCTFLPVSGLFLPCWVANSYPTLCGPMDYSRPGSSVLGISQARILEWVAIPFSRASSWPRDGTRISCIGGGFFTAVPLGKTYSFLALRSPAVPLASLCCGLGAPPLRKDIRRPHTSYLLLPPPLSALTTLKVLTNPMAQQSLLYSLSQSN